MSMLYVFALICILIMLYIMVKAFLNSSIHQKDYKYLWALIVISGVTLPYIMHVHFRGLEGVYMAVADFLAAVYLMATVLMIFWSEIVEKRIYRKNINFVNRIEDFLVCYIFAVIVAGFYKLTLYAMF